MHGQQSVPLRREIMPKKAGQNGTRQTWQAKKEPAGELSLFQMSEVN